MDLATIIGMVISFGLIIAALMAGGDILLFVDVPSMMIVFGGTIGATLTHYPLGTVLAIGHIIRKTLV
ncbi:MAG: motility protein A, partial [Desulfovibrio sp.]|nr:motility protein A [Desulfovibrio sp.]